VKRINGPFEYFGGHAWRADARLLGPGDDARAPYRSEARLYENGKAFPGAHAAHDAVRAWGRGLYSHWESSFVFSASDNTDPNTNGRCYEVDASFTVEDWDEARWRAGSARWLLHPRGRYFLERGGAEVAPPAYCNLGLTNKCNLRCEICGSQKYLDETGVRRRHMDYELFEQVAETLFPFLYEVELNSQGDPLLHPRIGDVLAAIARHDCNVKVQTNGTLLSDRLIALLKDQHGFVMLSLDAVGPRFDEVRRGGRWSEAEPQLEKFLAARDPRRVRVGIYPTLTARTVGEALNIVRWAAEHDVDEVAFHRYVPVKNSFEEIPPVDGVQAAVAALRTWLDREGDVMEVKLDGAPLNAAPVPERRTAFASPHKRELTLRPVGPGNMFPMPRAAPYADPVSICVAPRAYIEIGLDGQVSACCRSQDVPLGYATSVEAFAEAWFGRNYRTIRDSLKRSAGGALPLVNCGPCIQSHAPDALYGRAAENGLDFTHLAAIRLEAIQQEFKHCHISRLPPGIDPERYALYEDEVSLGPGKQLHDDIRLMGQGRFSIWGQALYFSSSDNSDARLNGRCYTLRRL
jgi:MoaA/NifB/PqqE/SkfB family radical SAM enzyme